MVKTAFEIWLHLRMSSVVVSGRISGSAFLPSILPTSHQPEESANRPITFCDWNGANKSFIIIEKAAVYFELQLFSIYNLKFRIYNKDVEKETDAMVNKWQTMIPELSGEEKRNVYLYLPEPYSHEQEKRYPVLYMFDGHNVIFDSDATYGKSRGMKEYAPFPFMV